MVWAPHSCLLDDIQFHNNLDDSARKSAEQQEQKNNLQELEQLETKQFLQLTTSNNSVNISIRCTIW